MKIGILGTGRVARLLAPAWRKAGHDIVLGSREPNAKQLDFPVQSLGETVRGADIVVDAILGSAVVATISTIPAEAFAGKTLIDVANAITPTFELIYPNASLAELLQAALPNARVVKTMNTAAMTLMTNPTKIGPSSVFLSGDSTEAKAQAAALLKDLGWTDDAIVDLGGIESARGAEAYFALFDILAAALKTDAVNIRVVRVEG
jgi:predicted dinucleotide-binding enzyme